MIHWLPARCLCGEPVTGVVIPPEDDAVLMGCQACVVRWAATVRRVQTAAAQDAPHPGGSQPMPVGQHWQALRALRAGDPAPMRAYLRMQKRRSRAKQGRPGGAPRRTGCHDA